MHILGCLLMLWIVCASVSSSDENQNGFIQPLEFQSLFNNKESGIASLASSPIAAAVLKVDKSQYPQLFDTIVSSSIDSVQSRRAPRESVFNARNFGFNPIASQGFLPYGKSAKLVTQQTQQQQANPIAQRLSPLLYDIRTVHDPYYRVHKPDENEEGKEILQKLQKNPTVAAYFQPTINVEVKHPVKYRKEDSIEKFEGEPNYKQNPYIAGPARIRRYTGGRGSENLKKTEEDEDEDDDPYNYKAEYISKPKAFDESPYSSPYKKKKDSEDKYEYPYNYDSGYDHKEYERIKELSEKQAAEIRQNPGNCKEVKKDGMTCMTCKDAKTGGNYESCSYVAAPKNNKYAYSKEKKFDSNDDPEEPENEEQSEGPKTSEKIQEIKTDDRAPQKFTEAEDEKPYSSYRQPEKDDSSEKYKAFYIHSSKPKPNEALREASNEDSSEEEKPKSYDYQKALPGFYTDNEPKKDVEHVLAEFKNKDRSSCKKVQKNAMTCYQCVDKQGLKHEECMFVSESAPKQSHLAYQELKEFTSKPATLDDGNETAESQTVTTSATPTKKSAAYVAGSANYGKKLKRKKASQGALTATATNVVAKTTQKVKRSEGSESNTNDKISDASNIAPPEEFAGSQSKAAFWAETVPRYSAALGVTLPEYMLSRSEHEASFDEAVAGA